MSFTIPDYAQPLIPDAKTDWKLFDSIVYALSGTTNGEDLKTSLMYLDWWRWLNIEVFGERLQPLFISREVAAFGHWIGLCSYHPRHIKLAGPAFKAVHHDNAIANRLDYFKDLSGSEHNAAMVILHEMIHQSLFEAKKDTTHEGQPWMLLCKYIGGILDLPYDYCPLKKAKEDVLDENGNPTYIESPTQTLKGGKPKMIKVRRNIWVPNDGIKRDESKPLAPYHAYCCFPYVESSAFIQANTVTKTTGKKVEKNDGKPVTIPPSF